MNGRENIDENAEVVARFVSFFRRAREAKKKGEPMPGFDERPDAATTVRVSQKCTRLPHNCIDATDRFRRR